MSSTETKELHNQYVMPTYAPGMTLVKGKGVKVWDDEEREYLDFLAGISVLNVGHCHPAVVKAIKQQCSTLMHTSNLYFNENQPRLARKLSELSLGGKCFFCNSGAEANEALMKLARLWGHEQGRYEIITARNSFHGRSLATLTATGQAKIQKGFDPLPQGYVHAEFNNIESFRAAVTDNTVAILIEAVQGEGGVVPAEPGFIQGLRTLCDEKNLLLFFDEVQCGLGRTGHWFGYQGYDVTPDAISLAKALGGGFPIGAIVTTERLADVFQPGHHATTFGGTPLATAAAMAVIQAMEDEQLITNAREMGAYFMKKLSRLAGRYDFIDAVRGAGLMVGLVLNQPAKDLELKLRDRGVLALATAENVLRFLPPLIVKKSHLNKVVRCIREACEELKTDMKETT